MTNNPFNDKPTIQEGKEQKDESQEDNDIRPMKVKEDYSEIRERDYKIRGAKDENAKEWGQPPVSLFSSIDQEKFNWVIVTVDDDGIPHVRHENDDYNELLEKRKWYEARYTMAEGIHVRLKKSNKYRHIKGEDAKELLARRDLA